jgi:eukaryotic-like serine/threonine-protein kinase
MLPLYFLEGDESEPRGTALVGRPEPAVIHLTNLISTGTRLGPYEILAPLGAGGMGEVFKARDTKLGRDVAVKVLSERSLEDEEGRARFEREARALAALNHPNIAAIYSFEEISGRHFLIQELLEGETLRQRLAEGPLPVRKAVELARQIAEGLAAAHERGIVHRDLKPENIFVTREARAKILDFGLAKEVGREAPSSETHSPTVARQTEPGTVMGTVGYMSPEQVRGLPSDARSDLFSFGAVLYEMLTGRRAFQKETAAETMTAILREDPPDLASSGAPAPPALERIVRHCLEKVPEERFRSAHDLAFALEAVSGSSSTSSAALPAPRVAPSRRAVLAFALLAAGVLAGFSLDRILHRSPASGPVAIRPITSSGRDAEPAVSPDGKTIAFSSNRDGKPRIWLKQLPGGQEVALTSGEDHSPRFSPDGAQLLFTRQHPGAGIGHADLFRVPILGGEPRKLIPDVGDADFSPDGRQIAFTRNSSQPGVLAAELLLVATDGGEPRRLARFEKTILFAPRFRPDGRSVVVTSIRWGASGVQFEIVDLDGKKVSTLEPPPSLGGASSAAWLAGGNEIVYSQALLVRYGGSQIVRQNVGNGRSKPLLWAPFETTALDVLPDGRLLADFASTRQSLTEVPLRSVSPGTRWLTRGTGTDRQPAFSPDGEWVAFSSNRSGNLEIWEISRKTGAVRRLTEDPADDWDPGFTPDGRLIWSSGRSGHLEIWIADADGSAPRRLTDDGTDAQNPTATPDGWIVYCSAHEKKAGLWKVRVDGSQATQLVTSHDTNLPDVSPDGRYVAYVRRPKGPNVVRVARVSDGTILPFQIQVSSPRATDVSMGRVRWMPGGKAIAFVGQDEKGVNGIFVQDFEPEKADTSATRRRLGGFDPNLETESFAISPDGSSLVIAQLEHLFGLATIEGLPDIRRPVH